MEKQAEDSLAACKKGLEEETPAADDELNGAVVEQAVPKAKVFWATKLDTNFALRMPSC